ncbi:MAG: aromatic ring-hydroxylating oxygenase subunit alpha [Acidimicrobiales bacterium]
MHSGATEQESSVPLARSLDRLRYVDEGAFATERDCVLAADWFCIGREESIGETGQYLTACVAGESIIAVRGAGGEITSHFNLCRHRGSRLVPASDCQPAQSTDATGCFAGNIRCPYHGWTYGLDGELRAAPYLPEMRRYRGQLSLHRVETGVWGGFVFVRLGSPAGTSVAPALATSLGGTPGRLANYELGELRIGKRLVYEVSANYKVILENYNECYHCGPVHPELCELVPAFRRGGDNLDWEAGVPHRQGANSFTVTGTTERAPFPRLSKTERVRHKGEVVLPNLMISCSADHVAAFVLWPRSAAATTVVCDFLFHPSELAKASFDPSDAVDFWDLVNRQDWWICEQVQDGMTSRKFAFGYLAPMEQPSADVGQYVAQRVAAARSEHEMANRRAP